MKAEANTPRRGREISYPILGNTVWMIVCVYIRYLHVCMDFSITYGVTPYLQCCSDDFASDTINK